MTRDKPKPSRSSKSTEVSQEQVVQLLTACVEAERRPVDALVERLREADASSWLDRALVSQDMSDWDQARLCEGRMNLSELRHAKEASKTLAVDAATRDESLGALLVYILCVAAAQKHHHELISTQSRDVWDDTWVRLADALHEPWRQLLLDAAAG